MTLPDGSLSDVTSATTWSIGSLAVGTFTSPGLLTCQVAGTTVISASYGGAVINAPIICSVPVMEITSIPVLNVVGSGSQLHATLAFIDGSTSDVTNTASWISSNPLIAHINAQGLLLCASGGSSTISASMLGASATSSLNCSAPRIAVSPIPALNLVGQAVQLTAMLTYIDGSSSNATETAIWVSSAPAVASITDHGVMNCLTVGTAQISVSDLGAVASSSVTCSVSRITISSLPAVNLVGQTKQVQATVSFADGTTKDITQNAAWVSSAPSIAGIDSLGHLKCEKLGTAQISASDSGQMAQVNVTCSVPQLKISAVPSVNLVGTTVQLAVVASFADGTSQDATGEVAWTSSEAGVASFSTRGALVCEAVGTTQIAAALDTASASVPFTCSLPKLTISVPNVLIAVGKTVPLAASVSYIDGSTKGVTDSASWFSSSTEVAMVNTNGLLTCKSHGNTTVSATSLGVAASTTIVCSVPQIAILGLPGLNLVGHATQLKAVLHYPDGSSMDVTTSASWTSSAPTVASINGQGLLSWRQNWPLINLGRNG